MINLRVPGPTPLPSKVMKILSQQMINHRGLQYEKMQSRITANLRHFFQTRNDIFLLTSSGMGGLEAAVSNFFSPGDKLVFFTCGEFGNRWAEIGRRYGGDVVHIKFPPGKSIDRDEVYRILKTQTRIDGVFFTHNETASGVLNVISDFAPIVKGHSSKPLLMVDSISALGAVSLPMDVLGIDVLVSASQKAWMAPPGLAFLAVSSNAWKRHEKARMPHYYFDISLFKKFAAKNQTPATPAVSILFGLDVSLALMKKEGKEKIYKRHLDLMNHLREGVRKLGLQLFVEEKDASPTVTSIEVPEGIDAKEWLTLLKDKYNCILAGGMGETKGKIIRVAHLGLVNRRDINNVLMALKKSLQSLKWTVKESDPSINSAQV